LSKEALKRLGLSRKKTLLPPRADELPRSVEKSIAPSKRFSPPSLFERAGVKPKRCSLNGFYARKKSKTPLGIIG
jgi:hypothetical protein